MRDDAVGEDDLVLLLRAGDERAYVELVERFHPRLVRLAMTFVGSRDLAEDVAQETWLAALRGLDRFEGRSSLRSWLFQICANRARSVVAREGRMRPVGAAGPPAEDVTAAVDDRIDATTLAELARTAIGRLPAGQRQVVTLRDVEGLDGVEVCALLGLTDANQRVLLHRGRATLRRVLSPAFAAAGPFGAGSAKVRPADP